MGLKLPGSAGGWGGAVGMEVWMGLFGRFAMVGVGRVGGGVVDWSFWLVGVGRLVLGLGFVSGIWVGWGW